VSSSLQFFPPPIADRCHAEMAPCETMFAFCSREPCVYVCVSVCTLLVNCFCNATQLINLRYSIGDDSIDKHFFFKYCLTTLKRKDTRHQN
jgi:hypothetical protein